MPSPSEGAPDSGTSGAPGARSGINHNGVSAAGRVRVAGIQRVRVVAAMVEVSAEYGLADATVARVVARAGVSRRTFYELFDDRESCFLAALDDAIARASECVVPAYESGDGWAERLRLALAALLSFLDVERGVGQLLIVGSLGAGPRAIERRQRVLAQIITAVELGRSEGKAASGLPPLTAEGIVGAVFSIIHARMVASLPACAPGGMRFRVPPVSGGPRSGEGERPLTELAGPLMGMVVLPYLGPAAARRELERSVPAVRRGNGVGKSDPLQNLGMRLTYRTVRVLLAVAANPGSSNRVAADAAGIVDQGQISKLLARLQGLGLVENRGADSARGEPNAWTLTPRGREVHGAIDTQTASF